MNKLVKALDRHIEVRQSTADLGFGIGVLLVDLFLMFVGVAKYISAGYTTSYGITAKTFPKVVFIAGIILSAILIVTALTKRVKNDPKEGKVTFTLNDLETMEGKTIMVNGNALTVDGKSITIDVAAGDKIAIVCTSDSEASILLDVKFEEKKAEPAPTDPPATNAPTTPPTTGTTGTTEEPSSPVVIIVIVVVVIAAAVVAVVVLKKKK